MRYESHTIESAIERRYIEYVKTQGDTAIKLYKRHWPDRLTILNNGCVVFIEFKQPGKKLQRGQAIIIKHLRNKGHEVYVCTSTEDAIDAYEKAKL